MLLNPPKKSNIVLKTVTRVLWDTDLVASRFTLALAEFAWAVMLLWEGETFSRPPYAHMALIANEEVWGALFALSGATQLSILLMSDLHSKFARYFASWNSMLWCYTVWSMLASVYPPPAAIGGEVALAAAAVWIWVRPYILAEGYRNAGY